MHFWSNRRCVKILVTGSTGNVGLRVLEELRKRQVDVLLGCQKSISKAPPCAEIVVGGLLFARETAEKWKEERL